MPATIPGVVQAEDFDNGGEGVAYHDLMPGNAGNQYRTSDVDVRALQSAGGGFAVFNAYAGEWLEYTVNIATAGTYDVNVSVAARYEGGTFHLEVDGVNVTGALRVPATGSWQTFQPLTRSGVNLPAGTHVLKLVFDTNGTETVCGDFDAISFTPGTPSTASPTLVSNAYALAATLASTPGATGDQLLSLLNSIEQAYAAFNLESGSFTTADQMDKGLRVALYFTRAAAALCVARPASSGVQNRLQIAASYLGLVKNLMLPPGTGSSSSSHANLMTTPIIGAADTRSSASFAQTISSLSLGSILGDATLSPLASQTSFSTQAADGSFPYELSGVTVTINGQAAQLLSVSPARVNFLVPTGLATGSAEVIVTSDDGYVSRGTASVVTIAPALFATGGNGVGAGVVLNAATGAPGAFDDLTPQNFGTDKRTRLLLMATGIGGGGLANYDVSNDVRVGTDVVENFAESVQVEARLQDGRVFQLPVEFAGRQSSFAGLDQVNVVLLPELRHAGTVELTLVVGGQRSNSTTISVR